LEIALLKSKIGNSDDQSLHHRGERPVRLLPPHVFQGERKNETEQQKQMNPRRYEQPANCSDLSILGYTLNGFYLVKSDSNASTTIKLETVYCAFKQIEGTFNPSLVEKRIISRRDTGSKRIFQVERTKTFDAQTEMIGFDKSELNLGGAFDTKSGVFTVPKSGVYLLLFRGILSHFTPTSSKELSLNIGWYHIHNNGKGNVTRLGGRGPDDTFLVSSVANTHFAELEMMVKANRGDLIMTKLIRDTVKNPQNCRFSGNAAFIGYFLTEE